VKHVLRVTVEDYSARGWRKEFVADIDDDDYDPENRTVGSLVWDAWTVTAWPMVKPLVEELKESGHDDMRLLVTFDNTYVADVWPQHATEDLFTASWVAQHDEPLGVMA
jgi:hypothetical protein